MEILIISIKREKYRFSSIKSFLQIISIANTIKVIVFLKCTRTSWTP